MIFNNKFFAQGILCQTVKIVFLLSILIILTVNGCGRKEEKHEIPEDGISYPLKTAKMVSHVTGGVISGKDEIAVRFVSPMVKSNLVGNTLKKEVFSFEPEIKGLTKWKDRQTLVFIPNKPLTFREKYKGTLDIATLLPQHKDKDLKVLEFDFEVAGLEIVSVKGDFTLKDKNIPRYILFEGTITFTEFADSNDVKKATNFERLQGKDLKLIWKHDATGKIHTFTSETFERTDQKQNFVLKIDKKPVNISLDYQKQFELSPLKEMEVKYIQKDDGDNRPLIKVEFSDELDKEQDITGLITITPHIDLNLKTIDKVVMITGNFEYGKTCTLLVHPGVRSKWATKTKKEWSKEIEFADLKPEMRFDSDGVFLPSANEQKVAFHTINLRRVHIEVKKVFESNLGFFLQNANLNSPKKRTDRIEGSQFNRVGVVVADKTLEIGDKRNEWLQHQLDLKNIIKPGEKGLFTINLTFNQRDMLYGPEEDLEEAIKERGYHYSGDDYYSNPYSRGYTRQHGRIYKGIVLSDIGLTYKKSDSKHIIYATDILSAKPLAGVKIILRTYQNQVIAQQETDANGKAEFTNVGKSVFYIEGEKNEQRSVIKPNEMAWNTSTFDTGGEATIKGGTRAYIYTERGVYRPGDEINLSVIVRNDENTFPDNHPVTLKVYNPQNQVAHEMTLTKAIDGFYNFKFTTNMEDPTGNWRAEVKAGSQTFNHTLKIETVVPFKLKVNIEPEKEKLTWEDEELKLNLSSKYLFGNPASNLNAEVEITLNNSPKRFARYSKFSFTNEFLDFKTVQANIFKGKLSGEGKADINWEMPSFENAPSGIKADITATVFEKGGRPNNNRIRMDIDPYQYYVGIEHQNFRYGYARIGSDIKMPVILVNPEGEPVAGRPLTYRVYKNSIRWWWEYRNYREYQLKYKTDLDTELIAEGTLVSENEPVAIDFRPEDRGQYLIEVQDGETGHKSTFFMQAYRSGYTLPSGQDDAGIIALKLDKEKYHPGDEAVITFPAPEQGMVLVSVEKANEIIASNWIESEPVDGEMTFKVPIVEEMTPNSYVSVSLIQPHSQTANDRPIRMYGVIPLHVEDPETRQHITIKMADELKSKEKFTVEIQNESKEQTQFTIAVVDEGLLDLTKFKTPDPWRYYFKKLRLGVKTYDLFAHIIGANKGDIFKVFSIGGDMDDYRKSQLAPGKKKKRFKPVSMFKGPIQTDKNGYVKVEFDMPNYIGAVRVMVISTKGKSYGRAEKTVSVKTDLMVASSLPRVLGPEDKITVPVTVFALKDAVGQVETSIKVEGPIKILGEDVKIINFDTAGEQDIEFEIQADAAVGQSRIEIAAKSDKMTATNEVDLYVRASSPRIYDGEKKVVEVGQSISFVVPDKGILGSNNAKVIINHRPNMDFGHRLLWLIRYPYGCIEQTTSAVMPQLYLKRFLEDMVSVDAYNYEKKIDKGINRGIYRLQRFQLSSGAFSYWPGSSHVSDWGTNYAGKFLIEAKNQGYHVPDGLLNNWKRYQKSQALKKAPKYGEYILQEGKWYRKRYYPYYNWLTQQVDRLYLLALAGEAQVGPMNLLRENHLRYMNDTQKWLLAGSYKLAGIDKTANQILKDAGHETEDYYELGGTYGSGLRDKAIILEMLLLFERWEQADTLAEEIAEQLSMHNWYSTQTTGSMLLALGKYLKAIEKGSDKPQLLSGTVTLPNGKKVDFSSEDMTYQLPITEGFGKEVGIFLSDKSTLKKGFVTLEWDGVPLVDEVVEENRNLTLYTEFLDEDGMKINPTEITQGTTFWGHFRVTSKYSIKLDEMALVQVLPAGWEIENIRLSNEAKPPWMSKWSLNREEYMDIRDDRIMWFFDLNYNNSLEFVVKLNAVTPGEYTLPGIITEAMYDNKYKARKPGQKVTVLKRQ